MRGGAGVGLALDRRADDRWLELARSERAMIVGRHAGVGWAKPLHGSRTAHIQWAFCTRFADGMVQVTGSTTWPMQLVESFTGLATKQ